MTMEVKQSMIRKRHQPEREMSQVLAQQLRIQFSHPSVQLREGITIFDML